MAASRQQLVDLAQLGVNAGLQPDKLLILHIGVPDAARLQRAVPAQRLQRLLLAVQLLNEPPDKEAKAGGGQPSISTRAADCVRP